MKKIKIVLLFLCSIFLLTAFKCAPVCKGCKDIEVIENNGIYVFKIPYEGNYSVKPFVSKKLIFNEDVFKKTNALLVINAGYFDPNNQQTSSYVVLNKKMVLDPEKNKNLIENEDLKPFMKQILNRTEFRIMNCNGKIKYDIAAHSTKPPFRCEIVHSIQAGPLLYPDLRLEDEYFVAFKEKEISRDSISALKKCARTAIGIKDNDIYVIIATVKNSVTLYELQQICKDLCLDKAMNFDGGGSTSVDFKGTQAGAFKNLHIISDKNSSARKLKSFLIFEKNSK